MINRYNPTPLYEQLKLILKERILRGDFSPGDYLPSEQQLCEMYDVSRITVARALSELVHEGFIKRMQGKGTVVIHAPIIEDWYHISGFTRSVIAAGHTTYSKILSVDEIESDARLSSLFQLPKSQPNYLVRIKRLRYVDNTPAVIMTSTMPADLGHKMLTYNLEKASFYDLFEKILQKRVVRNEVTLSAILASPETVELLEVKPESAHLLFRGVSYLEGNVPIELAIGVYRGDMFKVASQIHMLITDNWLGEEFTHKELV